LTNVVPISRSVAFVAFVVVSSACTSSARAQDPTWPAKTHYRYQEVNRHRIFYREAGDPAQPTILLLHGYRRHRTRIEN
jgi:hypothetical protein